MTAGRPSFSRHRALGMASSLCLPPSLHLPTSWQSRRRPPRGVRDIRCDGRSPSEGGSKSENAVLRLAWYGSELLGIAASFFRPSPSAAPSEELRADGSGFATGRAEVAEAIKEDFARSYFVTAYEDDCEFADPAGSFRGLRRFKRNCTNFGSLLEKSSMKLTKWEDFEVKTLKSFQIYHNHLYFQL
ncbi:hypothetical protein BHM03_00031944 [Ensete ventricosum]|nr:hypothetical protein BHM03_00031944 [Ensete ventricosum]